MNKKIFILLPAAALLLAGCGGNNGSSSSSSSDSSSSSSEPVGPSVEDYGSAEAPLSVAKFLSNVTRLCKAENEAFSDFPFYIKGVVDANAGWDSSYGQYATFYMKDNVSDKSSAKVQRAKPGSDSVSHDLYGNDSILLRGFAEYYDGGYSLFPNAGVSTEEGADVVVQSIARGESKFTVTPDAAGKVSVKSPASFEEKYANGTVLDIELEVTSGYLPEVYNNGVAVQPESPGKYKIKVAGNTDVVINSDKDVEREDLPSGDHKVKVTYDMLHLPKDVGSTAKGTAKINVIADDEVGGHYYKRLELVIDSGCYWKYYSTGSEFFVGVGSHLYTSAPTGTFTKVTVSHYKYVNCDYYANNDASGDKLKKNESESKQEGNVIDNVYDVNNANFYVNNASKNAQGLYFIEFTIHVA